MNRRASRLCVPATLVVLCSVALLVSWLKATKAQSLCSQPPASSISHTWPQLKLVTVNIDPTFEKWKFDAIKLAFENWNGSKSLSLGNCSEVTFIRYTRNT